MTIIGPEVYDSVRFGSGRDLYLENVQCDGSERRLEDCYVSREHCSHSDAVGVSCQGIQCDKSRRGTCMHIMHHSGERLKYHVPIDIYASS